MDKEEKFIKKFLNLNPKLSRTSINFRIDGRIEYVCRHGVGHPIYIPEELGVTGSIHCCDGCCCDWVLK